GPLCHMREFIENTVHLRTVLQDCGDQCAVPSADIHNTGDAAEIVCLYDSGGDHLPEIVHGPIEDLSLVGVCCEVVEKFRSCGTLEDRFTGPDAVKRLGIRMAM